MLSNRLLLAIRRRLHQRQRLQNMPARRLAPDKHRHHRRARRRRHKRQPRRRGRQPPEKVHKNPLRRRALLIQHKPHQLLTPQRPHRRTIRLLRVNAIHPACLPQRLKQFLRHPILQHFGNNRQRIAEPLNRQYPHQHIIPQMRRKNQRPLPARQRRLHMLLAINLQPLDKLRPPPPVKTHQLHDVQHLMLPHLDIYPPPLRRRGIRQTTRQRFQHIPPANPRHMRQQPPPMPRPRPNHPGRQKRHHTRNKF